VHVFVLKAHVVLAVGTFFGFAAAIRVVSLVIFEFYDLITELAGLGL
jgi:hypothetical protein